MEFHQFRFKTRILVYFVMDKLSKWSLYINNIYVVFIIKLPNRTITPHTIISPYHRLLFFFFHFQHFRTWSHCSTAVAIFPTKMDGNIMDKIHASEHGCNIDVFRIELWGNECNEDNINNNNKLRFLMLSALYLTKGANVILILRILRTTSKSIVLRFSARHPGLRKLEALEDNR